MTSIHFTIMGRLQGKGRPRFTMAGGFPRAYTPAKTRKAEADMAAQALVAMAGRKPLEGPLALDIRAVQNPPVSWSKAKKESTKWVTGKPDVDNAVKMIDSFNGIMWLDDSQIAILHFERRYSQVERERVEFTVRALSEAPWTK